MKNDGKSKFLRLIDFDKQTIKLIRAYRKIKLQMERDPEGCFSGARKT